jgi:hypothetical protein
MLEYERSLAAQKGVSSKALLRFAGSISEPDAKIWQEAIEDGCEKVIANQ